MRLRFQEALLILAEMADRVSEYIGGRSPSPTCRSLTTNGFESVSKSFQPQSSSVALTMERATEIESDVARVVEKDPSDRPIP